MAIDSFYLCHKAIYNHLKYKWVIFHAHLEGIISLALANNNTVARAEVYICWRNQNQYHEINRHATPNSLPKSGQQKKSGEKNIDYR